MTRTGQDVATGWGMWEGRGVLTKLYKMLSGLSDSDLPYSPTTTHWAFLAFPRHRKR